MTHAEAVASACAACVTGTRFDKTLPLQSRNRHDVVDVGPLCTVHLEKCRNVAKKNRSKRPSVAQVEALVEVASVQAATEIMLTVEVAQQAVPATFVLQQDGNWSARDTSHVFGMCWRSVCRYVSQRHRSSLI